VARILVADDNSNIQKMVGLALKDQGIDVVAVGNGEAAVRKISDLRPDLVLADVFMPVRNGYEVCKYVKDDSTLAHIPVILLVGAFDPLDEQEAQRVGADGVLKKPFVPPDPLISMVKSALLRSSAAQAAAAAQKAAESSVNGGANSAPVVSAAPTVFEIPKEQAPVESDSFVDEIPPKPEALKIESEGKPLAFGSLLETPTTEPVDDAAFEATPNPRTAIGMLPKKTTTRKKKNRKAPRGGETAAAKTLLRNPYRKRHRKRVRAVSGGKAGLQPGKNYKIYWKTRWHRRFRFRLRQRRA
jgi:CheY-like chemotaxis protein